VVLFDADQRGFEKAIKADQANNGLTRYVVSGVPKTLANHYRRIRSYPALDPR
jgi:hypothetical protein